ncbi:dTMP kinase [Brevundimonas sp. 2R-24]|uniref:Thymidylate kinase n=1 Tax=Peiella sedimenti TaxID=3061083 RepID=A0ABT8SJ97_9CAUL|nr:dTMP kinase [Caulobacteraceae bacterium XZ-24]
MARGRFITFEGGEGTGKSTQIARLAEALRGRGLSVVQTREPGGSPGAEALRALLVNGEAGRWTPTAEALLMYAARDDHLNQVIRPALERGDWVLCDRFSDSTRAYQGAGGKVDATFIEALDMAVVGADRPDLTLIFDLEPQAGLERAKARAGGEDRFESKGEGFHRRLREGFLKIAEAEPDRCRIIDAGGSVDAVGSAVWEALRERWPGELGDG